MLDERCSCGCGEQPTDRHHVIYQQHLREVARRRIRGFLDGGVEKALIRDERNLVPVAFACHGNHHNAGHRYPCAMVPDSVFEFGLEIMDAGELYEYLRRRYSGEDPRLAALLTDWEAANAA